MNDPNTEVGMMEKIAKAIAWKLPRSVVMWCAVRVWAHGTQGPWSNQDATTLPMHLALKRWGS